MSSQPLSEVRPYDFYIFHESSIGLEELEILSFQVNRIAEIPSSFSGLKALREIHAMRNQLRTVPAEAVAKWQNLEVLGFDW